MAARKDKPEKTRRRQPATPEEYESRLINKALALVERQIDEGTATSQVLTHFLKASSQRDQLERQKLVYETELLQARTEALESAGRLEELTEAALRAMRSYQGIETPGDEHED